ncbi:putative CW7 protein [Quillaja saponaria]|uniref:CW7 protein n=1 Tax=Quillaja saponaria TaxID=32244 RepID=A0AAD7LYI0_QUISA|nr:putative CW7 protein [Quillaja saponaria]
MLGDGGETPSRYELLGMVKKHSNLLGKTIVDEEDASDVEMNPRFWHDVFNLYFVRGKESRGRQDDDLVFFVRKMGFQGNGSNHNKESAAPYFVRRWASKLDNLVGEASTEVDWRRSFYLNFIAHTSFSVTVAICSHQVLQNHRVGENTPLSPIYKVVKTVYASPSRLNFHLDSRKEAETTPAYPDICFAVDDFDSTFDAVVLTEKDHCYCVVLNAHDGSAFPNEKEPQDCSSSDSSSLRADTGYAKADNTKLTLFSGFVSYQMVRDAYDAGKSGFGSLLSGSHSPGKTDRLYMKGPGGRGEVEVAVSGVADQSQQESGPFSPVISKRGLSIRSIVRRAASIASVAAKHAYAAASASTSNFDEEIIPLKCCLMSISLPWEHIAYDLLFKVRFMQPGYY